VQPESGTGSVTHRPENLNIGICSLSGREILLRKNRTKKEKADSRRGDEKKNKKNALLKKQGI
jgi:hypothetical protein